MDNSAPKIAVIGAGVVGLSVAKIFQEELRHSNVTVLAEKFREDTTSSVAAGIFRPGLSFKGPNETITKKWIIDSWDYWYKILKTSDAPLAGVTELSSYIFSKNNPEVVENHYIKDIVPLYRAVDKNELNLCPGGWNYGKFYTTMLIECKIHLPWLEKLFLDKGGKIMTRKVNSFAELSDEYDMVFNCTGLGAKNLCNDHDLVPMRGQIIKVKAPWVKTAFYADYDTYIIPGFDGTVTLGGTRQYDSYNLDVCKYDAAGIMERCCALLPGLKKAEVLGHRVGLRPHRSPVRVEADYVKGSKPLRLVHCYGHGGYGVTCAPGTAINAVQLGLDLLRGNLTKNKL